VRVIVCGGRDYHNVNVVRKALAYVDGGLVPHRLCLVHGSQRGADRLAAREAAGRGWAVEPHPPDIAKHGAPAAFHIRNQEMVDAGADLLIALPGGSGTEGCIKRAKAAGIPVREFSHG